MTRQAFTLAEVLLALAIFAVAIGGVLAFQATISGQRERTLARVVRSIAINNVAQLIEGTPVIELGRTVPGGERDWSLPRITSTISGSSNTTHDPMTVPDLIDLGIIHRRSGVLFGAQALGVSGSGLRINLEYFRSTANLVSGDPAVQDTSSPGVLDTKNESIPDFRSNFDRDTFILDVNSNIGVRDENILTPGNPVMVRMLVQETYPSGASQVISESWFGVGTN